MIITWSPKIETWDAVVYEVGFFEQDYEMVLFKAKKILSYFLDQIQIYPGLELYQSILENIDHDLKDILGECEVLSKETIANLINELRNIILYSGEDIVKLEEITALDNMIWSSL